MNKTESEYSMILETKLRTGTILDWRFEPMKFRLAEKTTYSPDFFVVLPNCFEIHATKGPYIREDSWVKLKTLTALSRW